MIRLTKFLKNLSIKNKLIITIMGISSFMLLSALSIFITSELITLKKNMHDDLSTLADLVGKNTYAAIMFYDQKAANENLMALNAKSHIVSAHLFTEEGEIFAQYHRNHLINNTENISKHKIPTAIIKLLKNKAEGDYITNNHIYILKKVIFNVDKTLLGFIHIESDRDVYWGQIKQYIYTTLMILVIALFATLVFAYQAQKIFTAPLLQLLKSMQHVTLAHKYTATIKNNYDDEFGELIDGYNSMLAQLEQHNQLNTHYQINLENRVEERTLQLRKARDEALSASRLKSIFLANMSHEIRTPMNAILGYTQLLQQSNLDDEQLRKLTIIDKSGNHLLLLINDILELSKIEAGSLELTNSDFDLHDLILNVENMFQIRCDQKNIHWRMEFFSQEPILVNGDQGKLRQILINLLSNACKFTEQGEVLLKVNVIADNHYQFLVKDTGSGIEEKALARVFDAFHQEKLGLQKGGTGLGLNISQRYVELMGGQLRVESSLGEGACFYFDIKLIPASEHFVQHENEAITHYMMPSNKCFKALIVEDNKENTELLFNILSQLGFDIACAENGQQGLNAIENDFPDIIFMDIRMPVMDGIEAIEIIRQQYSSAQLKCVAVTASTLQHSSEHFLQAGFDLFISKPFRFDEICYAVKHMLGVDLQIKSNSTNNTDKQASNEALDASIPAQLQLDPILIKALVQATEYSQLSELKNLLKQLQQYGDDGKHVAKYLNRLINSADLDGIFQYVEALANEQ
ncbi:ATP-binding protein [sulfur-oxidizing endosymbiont of Gigantopelta aegis]|uniref:ATP-binding protein n=1 Tax=sulfur-oxidizing endosymbiont of Gigantopelta aegis TaxID=2794934 RepID=UPI0018DD1451|nr:ATP-binding protein [sulfur-oxidizing endosymbiont of Gigantopelta aegis]